MKLRFIYAPVSDLQSALPFYRDTLGWSEAWRDGEQTIAFQVPNSDVQVMVVEERNDDPPGPMYLVESVSEFLAARPSIKVTVPAEDIPNGVVVGIQDPGGNTLYVYDQARP